MFVPFDTLPLNSRIWIYQSNRTFLEKELPEIEERLKTFINDWQRHGSNLKASFKIVYNQFIVIAVADMVSGCSIDASVHTLQQIEKQFNINLTDKMQTAFRNGDNINTVSLNEFKKYVGLNKITEDTIVFNNMVDTLEGLQTNWEVAANKSWHNRFFK